MRYFHVALKLVRKVIIKLDLSKTTSADCFSVVVLNTCNSEL